MEKTFKNSYKVAEKQMVSLSVYNVGFQKCGPLHQWGPGIRDHYLIHHIVSGKGCYRIGPKKYELSAGDTFLVYPSTEITYYADGSDPWEYYWVGFNGSDAPSILNATDFSKSNPVLLGSAQSDLIRSHLFKIYEARGSDLSHAVEMTGHLYTALALFIDSASQKAPADTYLSYVQKAVDYISYHYAYPITVEDVADFVGISRSHLYRAFLEHTGKPPKAYLSEFRIRQACMLLKKSDLSITAIANSVGFDNSLYFSKVFKKYKNLTPSDYMKSRRPK